jgi:hypothetical protein
MRTRSALFIGISLVGLLFSVSAHGVDQPIEGSRISFGRVDSSTRLIFVSRDPNALFPVVGGADDPATGTPGGATIEIFTANEGAATLVAPAGKGHPGWNIYPGPPPLFGFTNLMAPSGISPLNRVALRRKRYLRVVAPDVPFPLGATLGAVGIRVTMGSLRNCARFDAATIRTDAAGRYVALNARATALADCSDASVAPVVLCNGAQAGTCGGECPENGTCALALVNGLGNCACFFPSSPCGDTGPVCNGSCAAGERCVPLGPGGFLTSCGCIPEGSTPCGGAAPVCGGACPADQVCLPGAGLPEAGGQVGCFCAPPGQCGQGGIGCPNGFVCAALPPGGPQCFPIFCGTYPQCGGGCPSGSECVGIVGDSGASSFGICTCALPGSCDSTCGAYDCSSGEVCHLDTGADTCGCALP